MSPRTKEQNKEIREQTRQQILDAAFELFANEGYTHTSISAVAEKAGISKGLIYHYFDSKEAILEGIFYKLVEMGDEVLDFPEGFTPKDKIRNVLEQTFQIIETDIGTMYLMISLALQPDTFSSLKEKNREIQETQMKQYVSLFRELGYEEPELEAYRLGALLDGLLMGCITLGDEYPYEQMKTKIMEEYVSS